MCASYLMPLKIADGMDKKNDGKQAVAEAAACGVPPPHRTSGGGGGGGVTGPNPFALSTENKKSLPITSISSVNRPR